MRDGAILTPPATPSMKALTIIVTALSVPMFALNALGGIVSGIWLICLGQWKLVVLGLLVGIFATWFLSLAMMPAMGLILLGSKLAERGKFSGFLAFMSLASLWQYALISIWCIVVFFSLAAHATDKTIIPRMIWAYGVALAPLSYMAQGEDAGSGAMMLFSTCIACLVTLVMAIIGTATWGTALETFFGIMICGFLAQTAFVVAIRKTAKAEV